MAVDPRWLARVRHENQVKSGLAGLGQGGADLVQKFREARGTVGAAAVVAPQTPGSAATIGPVQIPTPSKLPAYMLYMAGGIAALGLTVVLVRAFTSRGA